MSDLWFDSAHLHDALRCIPAADWSLPSSYAATKVHHGYRRVTLVDAGRRWRLAEPFGFVLDRLAPIWAAWLSWIEPGGFIVPHRDAGPWRERWQVPVVPAGEFHAGTSFVPLAGRAFQVRHWEPHAVVNDTDRPRVHLVVDRAVTLDLPPAPFEVYPVPEPMAGLVERSLRGDTRGT